MTPRAVLMKTGLKPLNTLDVLTKRTVFFTDTACFVLSPDFKLPDDESQVLLKVPRKKNVYSVDMKKILFPKTVRTPAQLYGPSWVCSCFHLNTLDYLGKFDGKSDDGFFVGYSLTSWSMWLIESWTVGNQAAPNRREYSGFRISIFIVNLKYHSDVSAKSQGLCARTLYNFC
ncbi:hypothetical protein Tco_0489732 [Tanacetum coccineum]